MSEPDSFFAAGHENAGSGDEIVSITAGPELCRTSVDIGNVADSYLPLC